MAILRLPGENRTIRDAKAIQAILRLAGIGFEHREDLAKIPQGTPPDAILEQFGGIIQNLKRQGNYVTVDVIDVCPETADLDNIMAKFALEHWHDEDEVRLIFRGSGLFQIRPTDRPAMALEVEPGDLIQLPAGIHHSFRLCSDRRFGAIRLFKDPSGWVPKYSVGDVSEVDPG